MSRGLTYEWEDVIAACDDHVSIETAAVPTDSMRRHAWRAAKAARLYADRRPSGRGGDELVFALAQVVPDLTDHMAHMSMFRAAGTRAAYIEELWVPAVESLKPDVARFLEQFDHVFVGCAAPCEPLQDRINTPVTWLPGSVDHERFGLGPWQPQVVDVFSMGRRLPDLHDALVRWSDADRSRFYHYDTFTRNPFIADHRQHRAKLADFIRRSKYFVVNEAKVDVPGATGCFAEVGYRFFEGAATGSVMIGPPVKAPRFAELFPWDEPVVEIESVDDVDAVLKSLEEDPERRAGIRRRNIRGSLLRHDPAHRWRSVLQALDLEEPPGVGERIDRLAAAAESVDPQADSDEAAGLR